MRYFPPLLPCPFFFTFLSAILTPNPRSTSGPRPGSTEPPRAARSEEVGGSGNGTGGIEQGEEEEEEEDEEEGC